MKPRFATLVLAASFLAVTLAPGAGPVQAKPTIAVSNYGQYRTQKSGTATIEPRTAAGRVTKLSRWKLVRRTTVIFGQLGRDFGVEIDLEGFAEGPVVLTVRTLHPPLTNPRTGKTSRISEHEWEGEGRRKLYFGYTFSELWELAEGEWVKQFLYRGRVLAQQRFRVIVPMF